MLSVAVRGWRNRCQEYANYCHRAPHKRIAVKDHSRACAKISDPSLNNETTACVCASESAKIAERMAKPDRCTESLEAFIAVLGKCK